MYLSIFQKIAAAVFSASNEAISVCILYCISLHTDINECVRGTDNCGINAICSDTEGSFNCTCITGCEGSTSAA